MSHDTSGNGIMNLSRSRGFPAKLTYMMYSTPAQGLDAVYASLPAHLHYWADLEKRGLVLVGGPLLPEDLNQAFGGAGVMVFFAESYGEARTISAADPMHMSGARQFVLTPWLINHMLTTIYQEKPSPEKP